VPCRCQSLTITSLLCTSPWDCGQSYIHLLCQLVRFLALQERWTSLQLRPRTRLPRSTTVAFDRLEIIPIHPASHPRGVARTLVFLHLATCREASLDSRAWPAVRWRIVVILRLQSQYGSAVITLQALLHEVGDVLDHLACPFSLLSRWFTLARAPGAQCFCAVLQSDFVDSRFSSTSRDIACPRTSSNGRL